MCDCTVNTVCEQLYRPKHDCRKLQQNKSSLNTNTCVSVSVFCICRHVTKHARILKGEEGEEQGGLCECAALCLKLCGLAGSRWKQAGLMQQALAHALCIRKHVYVVFATFVHTHPVWPQVWRLAG